MGWGNMDGLGGYYRTEDDYCSRDAFIGSGSSSGRLRDDPKSNCYFTGTLTIGLEASTSRSVQQIHDASVLYNETTRKIELKIKGLLPNATIEYDPQQHFFICLTFEKKVDLAWHEKNVEEALLKVTAIVNFLKDAKELTFLKLKFGKIDYLMPRAYDRGDKELNHVKLCKKLFDDLIPQIINKNPSLTVLDLTLYKPVIVDTLPLQIAVANHLNITSLGSFPASFAQPTLEQNMRRNVTLKDLLYAFLVRETIAFERAQADLRQKLYLLEAAERVLRGATQSIQNYVKLSECFVDPNERDIYVDHVIEELEGYKQVFPALLGSTLDSVRSEGSAKRLIESLSGLLLDDQVADDPDSADDVKRQRRF